MRHISLIALVVAGSFSAAPLAAKPLKIGIIGTAKIAEVLIGEVKGSKSVVVTAVASRDKRRANAFAKRFGLARAYGSYEALFADDDIDVVYNPLPNSLHAEKEKLCFDSGLKSQTSLFIGGGLSFLP